MGTENKTVLHAAMLGAMLGGFSLAAHANGVAVVTNNLDSGPGSLRDALEVKEATKILIPRYVGDIQIETTLTYSSPRAVKIAGSGQTIGSENNVTLLAVTEGANLDIKNLGFQGPGGFSIDDRGDESEEAGKGIFIDVPEERTGKVKAMFKNVSVSGVANHGIHVSDCSLADECGSGSGGGGEGSTASVHLTCMGCVVDDVGNGTFDADGIRVDERGDGNIYAVLKNSSFTNVGADGVEFDEGDEGDVKIRVAKTDFSYNGGYCDADSIGELPPDAEFDEADGMTEEQLPELNTPDNRCVEVEITKYEDSDAIASVEYGIDTDDGIDADEAGPGTLWVYMVKTIIYGNLDEGVDMDEGDEGDIVASFIGAKAMNNADDGFKMTEEDAGDLYSTVYDSESSYNDGKGFVFEEEKDGDLAVSVRGTATSHNGDYDDTGIEAGIEATQEDPGMGTLKVRSSHIEDGIDLDGVYPI